MRNLAEISGSQHLVQPEHRAKVTPQFLLPKYRAYDFSSFFQGWVLSCKIEISKANIPKLLLFLLSLNNIH